MRFLVYMTVYMPQQSSLTGDTATWAHGAPNTPPLHPQTSPDHLWYLLFNRDALLSAKGDWPREVKVFIRAGGRVQLLHSKVVGESRRREWHTYRFTYVLASFFPASNTLSFHESQGYKRNKTDVLPYSQKIWWGIKFGGRGWNCHIEIHQNYFVRNT